MKRVMRLYFLSGDQLSCCVRFVFPLTNTDVCGVSTRGQLKTMLIDVFEL